MDINYNDTHEKLEFYCHKCHFCINNPHYDKYCSHCGHEFDPTKVNAIRQKIAKICFEEGH